MPFVLNTPTWLQSTISSGKNANSGTRSAGYAIDVVTASHLTDRTAAHWEELRTLSPSLTSPFFSSRYTRIVGELRPASKVAIIHKDGSVIAYLPFEFAIGSMIEPIGKAFNDAHGLICKPDQAVDYCDVLRAMGTKAFRYHALAGPKPIDPSFHFGTCPSFLADLEAHPEGYVPFLESTRETIFKQRRKTKKMIKDLGPLRLELDCRDKNTLTSLIDLKREQYQRTYIFDILGVSWAQAMLYRLWEDPSESCRGLLSALYAGDTLVAVHYGMMENGILHYWFPTYYRKYHQFSPGTAIFLEIARQAHTLGIKKIDLGYGEQPYKHKFSNTITEMPFGCVSCCDLTFVRERLRHAFAQGAKRIPGKPMLKKIIRSVWPSMGQGAFQ